MSIAYDIRNLRNQGDLERKRAEFFKLLKLQQKLNKEYEDAVIGRASSQQLGITPVAPETKSIEQQKQDTTTQLQILSKNLRTIMSADEAQKLITKYKDPNLIFDINSNFGGIAKKLEGRTNLTATFVDNFIMRYLDQMRETGGLDMTTKELSQELQRIASGQMGIDPITGRPYTVQSAVQQLADEYTVNTADLMRKLEEIKRPTPTDIEGILGDVDTIITTAVNSGNRPQLTEDQYTQLTLQQIQTILTLPNTKLRVKQEVLPLANRAGVLGEIRAINDLPNAQGGGKGPALDSLRRIVDQKIQEEATGTPVPLEETRLSETQLEGVQSSQEQRELLARERLGRRTELAEQQREQQRAALERIIASREKRGEERGAKEFFEKGKEVLAEKSAEYALRNKQFEDELDRAEAIIEEMNNDIQKDTQLVEQLGFQRIDLEENENERIRDISNYLSNALTNIKTMMPTLKDKQKERLQTSIDFLEANLPLNPVNPRYSQFLDKTTMKELQFLVGVASGKEPGLERDAERKAYEKKWRDAVFIHNEKRVVEGEISQREREIQSKEQEIERYVKQVKGELNNLAKQLGLETTQSRILPFEEAILKKEQRKKIAIEAKEREAKAKQAKAGRPIEVGFGVRPNDGMMARYGHTRLVKPRSRRIVGKGIAKNETTYEKFGRYLLYLPALRRNVLHLKFPSFVNIPSLPKKDISDDLREFVEDLLENGKLNKRRYDRLSPEERKYFNKIVSRSQIDEALDITDEVSKQERDEIQRFEMVKGIVMAGNNSPEVLKELREFLVKFSKEGKLHPQKVNDIMYDLIMVS